MSELYTVARREGIPAPDKRRPRLLPLEPIGLGTGDVESLTSYLVRLANAHWVSPRRLYLELIQLHIGRKVLNLKPTAGLDGFSNAAIFFTSALSECSPLEVNFSELSCLPWKDFVSRQQHGVMVSSMRWCVPCYEEMQGQGVPLHNKLLWSLAPVVACPTHRIFLSTTCSSCDRKPAFNKSNVVAGCCSSCGSALFDQRPGEPISEIDRDKQLWVARALHDLIRTTRVESPSHRFLLSSLESVVRDVGNGSSLSTAAVLGLPRDAIRGWTRDNKRPNLAKFIEFCFRLDIPPSKFFDETGELLVAPKQRQPSAVRSRHTWMSVEKVKIVNSELRKLIGSGAELGTLSDVAEQLGITRRVLADRFPEYNAIIAERGRARRDREKSQRDDARCQRVKSWAQELVSNGIYPSHRQVKKASGVLPSDLRNPRVIEVLLPIQKRCTEQGVRSKWTRWNTGFSALSAGRCDDDPK